MDPCAAPQLCLPAILPTIMSSCRGSCAERRTTVSPLGFFSAELTATRESIPDWQRPACVALVAAASAGGPAGAERAAGLLVAQVQSAVEMGSVPHTWVRSRAISHSISLSLTGRALRNVAGDA